MEGVEDGSFAEVRAGRREVVVTELQTLAGADTAERETPDCRILRQDDMLVIGRLLVDLIDRPEFTG